MYSYYVFSSMSLCWDKKKRYVPPLQGVCISVEWTYIHTSNYGNPILCLYLIQSSKIVPLSTFMKQCTEFVHWMQKPDFTILHFQSFLIHDSKTTSLTAILALFSLIKFFTKHSGHNFSGDSPFSHHRTFLKTKIRFKMYFH